MTLLTTGGPTGDDLLALYLNDHLTAATSGVQLFQRAAKSQLDEARRSALAHLGEEVASDREKLLFFMGRLGVKVAKRRVAIGWVSEKAGRLKVNGTLVRRSPLSDLIELEAMRVGVEAKGCLWRSLRMLSGTDARLDTADFEELEQRAHAQIYELETMRLSAAGALRRSG